MLHCKKYYFYLKNIDKATMHFTLFELKKKCRNQPVDAQPSASFAGNLCRLGKNQNFQKN